METPLNTLAKLNLTDNEKILAADIINRFGDGQHPVADNNNIVGFAIYYMKEIIMKRDSLIKKTITGKGNRIFKTLKTKLSISL